MVFRYLILTLMLCVLLMPFAVWLLILFVFVAKFDSIVISMHLEEDEQCFSLFFFFLLFPYIEKTKHPLCFKMTYFYLLKNLEICRQIYETR